MDQLPPKSVDTLTRETHSNCRIWSPMSSGSGAIRVHEQLATAVDGYSLEPFDPSLEFFPPLLLGLRNRHASVVHTAPDHGIMLVTRGQPLVVTFHNFVLDQEAASFSSLSQRLHYRTDLRWLTKLALKRATVITAVSDYTARKVESFYALEKPVHVIPNGIDTRSFAPCRRSGSKTIRVLVSGNASRRKGTHLLSAIAKRLAPGIEIVCTLGERELQRWVGHCPNVRAIGKQDAQTMPDIYRSSDILLMPTAREGFGLAVAEAMSCGLPIVASDRSTMPELVLHGKGGYLCSLACPEAFANRINQLAVQPGLCAEMGMFNRNRIVEKYSLRTMLDGYQNLFAGVLAGQFRS